MNIEQVVRVVEVRGQVSGMDQVARAYDQVAGSSEGAAEGAAKVSKAQADVDKALAATLRQLQLTLSSQQQFSDQMRQQAEIAGQIKAANDNSAQSFTLMGVEVASTANHLRQAAEAAYAFSPAFREVVNEMAKPALGFAASALAATAAGLVTATNVAGRALTELGVAVARSSSALAPFGANIALLGAGMAEFNPVLTEVAGTIAGTLLSAVLRIAGPILLVKDAVDLAREAWRLGGEELDKFRRIAEDAAKVDLSTQFFQKLTKGAEDAKVPVQDITTMLQNLQKVSAETLGGSTLDKKLGSLEDAGNFSNNSGLDQYQQANTSEEKARAVAAIIHQAMQDGERLAAIDLANTVFGSAAADHLRTDSEYLDKIFDAADKVSATRLVSDADIGNALELKNRYDAAVTILEQRWHPIQNVLTQLGVQMQQVWVSIVEAIAKGVDTAVTFATTVIDMLAKAYGYIKQIIDAVPDWVKTAAKASTSLTASVFAGPASGVVAGVATAVSSNSQAATATTAYSTAVDKLRAGLQNQNAVQQAVNTTNSVANKVLGDNSKTTDAATKSISDQNDAVDRAINSLQKHILQQQADAQAVGLGAGALATFQAQASETAAVLANKGKETEEQAARFAQLKIDAYNAADALAKLKLEASISFNNKTALLDSSEVAIARELANVYGDNVTAALNSSYAAAIRFNSALKSVGDAERTAFTGLIDNLIGAKTAMDALSSTTTALLKSLADLGAKQLFNTLTGQSGGFTLSGSLSLDTSGMSQAVKSGVRDGLDQYIIDAQSKNTTTVTSGGGGGGASNGAVAGIASVGAITGAYFNGQKTTDTGLGAGTGALSGALAGATLGSVVPGIGTAVGAVVGAITGAIAGYFGSESSNSQQHASDVAAWKADEQAYNSWIDTMNGKGPSGSLASAIDTQVSQYETYAKAAAKAGDWASVAAAQLAINNYQVTQALQFASSFKATIDALAEGLGTNSPFLKAVSNVKTELSNVQSFINDTKLADSIVGPALDLQTATSASEKYLLSLLQTQPALSATASSISTLKGTATELQDALTQLGMSASDAAAAINSGVVAAMQNIKSTFEASLTSRLNTANGQDYLNSATVLIAQHAQDIADAQASGASMALVEKTFAAEAQKIVNDAGLSGSALADFTAKFPELKGVVTDATSAITAAKQAAQQAVTDAQSAVTTATQNLTTAYQTEASALQSAIDKTNTFVQSLKDYANSLNVNSSLSALSPLQQYLASKSVAESDAALAGSGDAAAQGRLQGELTDFLNQSKSYNASTEQYAADFAEVQKILATTEASGNAQVSVAQQQLNALNQQVSGLITINNSVLSVADAIKALAAANAQLAAAKLGAGTSAGGGGSDNSAAIAALLTSSGLPVPADTSIYSGYYNILSRGYADGGIVGNGSYGVDSVIAAYAGGGNIALAGGEFVMPAPQTARYAPQLEAMRQGRANDNGSWQAVLSELQALRSEVYALRGDTKAGAAHVREGVDVVAAGQKQQTNAQRQADNRPQGYGARRAG